MWRIAALRTELVRTLKLFGAHEPEDGAQTILLRAWLGGKLVQTWPYWKKACKNMAIDQWKRQRVRPIWYEENDKRPPIPLWAEESWILGSVPDPMDTLPLTDTEKAWLVAYTSGDKVRAMRLRNKARNAAV